MYSPNLFYQMDRAICFATHQYHLEQCRYQGREFVSDPNLGAKNKMIKRFPQVLLVRNDSLNNVN